MAKERKKLTLSDVIRNKSLQKKEELRIEKKPKKIKLKDLDKFSKSIRFPLVWKEEIEKNIDYPQEYAPQILEKFPNKNPKDVSWTSFICTEFTSLCPMTGQPDFAKIYVNYIAKTSMVESKSMKLYLFSFRNHVP